MSDDNKPAQLEHDADRFVGWDMGRAEPATQPEHDAEVEVEVIVNRARHEVEEEVPYPRPIGEIVNIVRRAVQAGRELGQEEFTDLIEMRRRIADARAEGAREARDALDDVCEICQDRCRHRARGDK